MTEFRRVFFTLGRARMSGVNYGQWQSQVVRQQKRVWLYRQDSGQDVFVHHTSITGAGFKTLNEGDEVFPSMLSPATKGLKPKMSSA